MVEIRIDLLSNSYFNEQLTGVLESDGIDADVTQTSLTIDDENYSLLLLKYGTYRRFLDHISDTLFNNFLDRGRII